jgi:hypothetical protein
LLEELCENKSGTFFGKPDFDGTFAKNLSNNGNLFIATPTKHKPQTPDIPGSEPEITHMHQNQATL